METRITSSLEKCFWDRPVADFAPLTGEKIFKNQEYSFQLVIREDNMDGQYAKVEVFPEIISDIAQYITVCQVVNIPCEMPAYARHDDGVDRVKPGLFPDLLRPLDYNGAMRFACGQTRALFITVKPLGKVCGKFDVTVRLKQAVYDKGLKPSEKVLVEETITLDICDALLPEQTVMITQWLYADCLSDYYHVEMFSPKHMEIIENFVKKAVEGGRNMMLLPVFTYALDIYHAGERPTTQLVDIVKDGDNYTFTYEKLDKWLDMCDRAGVKYHEVSHLFTQWGAQNAPKVVATVNGKLKTIFGWNTDAASDEYTTFIKAFLQSFVKHMQERGDYEKCFFHISDEPQSYHLEQYKKVRAIVKEVIKDRPIMDALSDYSFYEEGLVDIPVPKLLKAKEFVEHGVKPLMCYYSGGSVEGVSNTLFSMPLARGRFLGTQLFKFKVDGFLNWGYNFYNNRWSYDTVDPYLAPDAEAFVPGGGAHMVYPGKNGMPLESIRFRVFYEAIEDTRAMEYCAKLYSHEETVKAIEDICGCVEFDKCVCDASVMLQIRRRINQMIFERLGI